MNDFLDRGHGVDMASIVEHPVRQKWIQEHADVFRKSVIESGILPELSFTIYLSSHSNEFDLEGMKQSLDAADIFFPEQIGWTKYSKDILQEVSNGSISPEDIFNTVDVNLTVRDFFYGLVSRLYNTKKTIVSLDQHASSSLTKKMFHLVNTNASFDLLDKNDSYDSLLREFTKVHTSLVDLQIARESNMLKFFGGTLKAQLDRSPSWSPRNQANMLIQLGMAHSTIGEVIIRSGAQCNEIYWPPEMRGYRSHLGTVMEMIRANLAVPQSLMARTLASDLFAVPLISEIESSKVASDTSIAFRYVQAVVARFSLQDIERLCTRLMGDKTFEQKEDILHDELDKRSITFPSSSRELHDFIADTAPSIQ